MVTCFASAPDKTGFAFVMLSSIQDDSYVDTYISTIGVDFVSSILQNMLFCLSLLCCSPLTHGSSTNCDPLTRMPCVSENSNCRARWKDSQATDCKLHSENFNYFTSNCTSAMCSLPILSGCAPVWDIRMWYMVSYFT